MSTARRSSSRATCRSNWSIVIEDAVPPADDRAGHGVGDRRSRARRSLFRRRCRGRENIRPVPAQCALRHPGPEQPRPLGDGGARCRCRTRGRRKKSPNCFRRSIRLKGQPKDQVKDGKPGAKPPEASAAPVTKDAAAAAQPSAAVAPAATTAAAVAKPVPLPEARPNVAPSREARRHRYRHHRHYRRGR